MRINNNCQTHLSNQISRKHFKFDTFSIDSKILLIRSVSDYNKGIMRKLLRLFYYCIRCLYKSHLWTYTYIYDTIQCVKLTK